MYTFELLDAYFAIVMLIILLVLAYVIGYTSKMERLTTTLQNETAYVDTLIERLAYNGEAAYVQRIQHAYAKEEQARALKRQHREAM